MSIPLNHSQVTLSDSILVARREFEMHQTMISTNETQNQESRLAERTLSSKSITNYFRVYTLCTMFTAIGGFLFGFDTGSIGPITVMPAFKKNFDHISPTLQGLIVSSILITASVASLFAGPLSDKISRTRTFALGGLIFGLGSVIECAAVSIPMLIVGRCVAGAGEGLFLSTITVYVCEIAPTHIRGSLSCIVQLFITIGVAAGYFVCYGTVKITNNISWRFPFGMQAIVAFSFASGCLLLPHSPRWLKHVGRDAEATASWTKLGFTALEAEKEQETSQRMEEQTYNAETKWYDVARQLIDKRVRKRTLLGCFMMGMNQACGIDGVLYYAPVLFSQAGLSSTEAAFLASGISGIVNVVVTVITLIYTDSCRRPSMIRGGLVISGTMLVIGTIYASRADETKAGRWTVIAMIYLFVIAFGMSWGVVNRIYCSEIQPIQTRAAATSLGQCTNWIVNWIIAFSTPLFLSQSSFGPYFMFGGFSLLTVLVCVAFQPESQGVSLEGLDAIFAVSPWRKILNKRRGLGVVRPQVLHDNISLNAL